ncbi:hypothetical protein L1887_09097 [Cichorium endivia]|nr:hypothetical protein L1887_09097 [Cichorium endivia]
MDEICNKNLSPGALLPYKHEDHFPDDKLSENLEEAKPRVIKSFFPPLSVPVLLCVLLFISYIDSSVFLKLSLFPTMAIT